MERIATVRRAVDETQLRGRSPGPGFPDVTVDVYVDHRFSFRADRIGDRARTEGDASGRTRRVRDRCARRERQGDPLRGLGRLGRTADRPTRGWASCATPDRWTGLRLAP